ncbi:MAG: 3-methyl-2-oxobutanoate dehydrogenase subunit VorB [Candidatus Omnitrophica bacterium]|nr:3-methyl-2-oxobutanoate dehydrogenase subunit VorB [Candidatus Omnitrophota bacterium]
MSKVKKILLSGNEAVGYGAIQAGCRFYAGYPITPQNELIAYMAEYMSKANGVFIQAESELAAISMVFGAAASGARAMTTSSSPGISLKQEGISYLAGCQLPAVIVNIMRGGPGLGNISPSQSDYFQATKGGGHGDYRCIVLAPATVPETINLMHLAFDLADKYSNPVMVLSDGMLGQMMEPVTTDCTDKKNPHRLIQIKKPWALTGARRRAPNVIKSLFLPEGALEKINLMLQDKYRKIEQKEFLCEDFYLKDSQIILVAYGTMSRIAKQAMFNARKNGLKVGLIRPITLWPFPKSQITQIINRLHRKKTRPVFLVVEMSHGQMLEDVRLAVDGKCKVDFYGRAGGGIPTEEAIFNRVEKLINEKNR